MKQSRVLLAGVLLAAAALPAAAQREYRAASNACIQEASRRLNVGFGDVQTSRADDDADRNTVINFRARRDGGGTSEGFCLVSGSGDVVRFRVTRGPGETAVPIQRGAGRGSARETCIREVANRFNVRREEVDLLRDVEERDSRYIVFDFSVKSNGGRVRQGQCRVSPTGEFIRLEGERGREWDRDRDRDRDRDLVRTPVQRVTNYPRVRVDTSGRGSFRGGSERDATVTRGWVDSNSDRVMVGLSGRNDFKLMFYGDVVESDGQRMVIRISDSDRGRATGTAELRLNRDRNEVETITINGRIQGSDFNGSFSR